MSERARGAGLAQHERALGSPSLEAPRERLSGERESARVVGSNITAR
jgi:hypothetical protein